MNYPKSLPLEVLEAKHPEYEEIEDTLTEIHLLSEGGFQLKKNITRFIKQKPGEEIEVYRSRIDKWTYNNILQKSINNLISKLGKGSLEATGLDQDPTFWQTFREKTDRAGKRSENELISTIFSNLLKYKKVYLHLDRPTSNIQPKNKRQAQQLNTLIPYVNVYDARQITNWSEDDSQQPAWIKLRQLTQDTSNPFSLPLSKAIWTFIDSQVIARYSAFVKLDSKGAIVEILNPAGQSAGTSAQQLISLQDEIEHNAGSIPVVKVELPGDLWVANQAAPKATQHLRVDCHKSDVESLLYIQRQWNPQRFPDPDGSETFEQWAEQCKTGSQYVTQGELEFKEARGDLLLRLQESLKDIEDQVNALISKKNKTASDTAVTQSGVAKAFDQSDENDHIAAYGQLITQAYQTLLQKIAAQQNLSTEISVTGLNDFSVDNVDTLLNKMQIVSSIPNLTLTETANRVLLTRLNETLLGNATAEQKANIQKEVDQLLKDKQLGHSVLAETKAA